ncbi:MAG TPA: tRNA (adenosine(37)-N6)-dimethylallyltransferase MiaA [Candidatus Baltobacteraceae bacterium]|nr:tRNA (adenosine(37)-N6)-dimethylallyltransferase MiaA [Candidatus Baltobacteraceae bacterium]
MPRVVLILAGATASGKTELAVELAQTFDAEIVGADSRQIYRDMPIGTAMPSAEQLAAVPHHLVSFLDPQERYSAARYAADALDAIEAIHRRGKRAIVVGGTGFYLRALTGGVSLASQYDPAMRDRLAAEARTHPPAFLHDWLSLRDPARAAALHPSDAYRILRALEIALAPARSRTLRTLATEGIEWTTVFLDVPLPQVDARISERAGRMLAAGFVEEAERVGESAVAANAVGYPQALAYVRGWSTDRELRSALERATRRYARRQRAWFRSEPGTLWLQAPDVVELTREKLRWSSKRA